MRVLLLFLLLVPGLGGCGRGGEVARKEFELTLRQGALPADQQVIRVHQGDEVILRWTTDEPRSIHLHGYDIEKQLTPGVAVAMWFVARATGRFPIMLHGQQEGDEPILGYLEVYPR